MFDRRGTVGSDRAIVLTWRRHNPGSGEARSSTERLPPSPRTPDRPMRAGSVCNSAALRGYEVLTAYLVEANAFFGIMRRRLERECRRRKGDRRRHTQDREYHQRPFDHQLQRGIQRHALPAGPQSPAKRVRQVLIGYGPVRPGRVSSADCKESHGKHRSLH